MCLSALSCQFSAYKELLVSFMIWDVGSTWQVEPESPSWGGAFLSRGTGLPPVKNLRGQPCVKHGLGTQRQGEGHVKREVKYTISAMPEEAWGAVRVWNEGRWPDPDLLGGQAGWEILEEKIDMWTEPPGLDGPDPHAKQGSKVGAKM